MKIAYKKKRKVLQNLKNERLKKIRQGYRIILRLWYLEKLNEFYDNLNKVENQKNISYKEIMDKRILIIREKDRFIEEFRKFPIGCTICANQKSNLIYSPMHNSWFCPSCYKISREHNSGKFP